MHAWDARGTASGLLGGHSYYLHWGVVQIALANLLVIAAMIVIFVLALVLPFPGTSRQKTDSGDRDD